jgi:hypothetical protein
MKITRNSSIVIVLFILCLISCEKENIKTQNLTIELNNVQNNTAKKKKFTIGQKYGGGYIYYIDATGQHGLIVSLNDLAGQFGWSPSNPGLPIGALSEDGNINTNKIIKTYGKVPANVKPYAALAAKRFNAGGFKDWYLPSYLEIQKLNEPRLAGVNLNIAPDLGYITSSEDPFNGGGYQVLYYSSYTYSCFGTSKDNASYAVRPIRKF